MHRRELFAKVGVLGAAALAGNAASAASHADAKPSASPLAGHHVHFCGIHTAKNNPKFILTIQHYCAGHSSTGHDDMFQCVLFDSTGANAKLLGVEYVISNATYRALPEAEKKYWHRHTYEVLSGGLVAPGMLEADEKKFMKTLLTTWGKAWHTWPDPKTAVPVGEPLLIWSLTGDGQCDNAVVAARDKEFGIDTAAIRARRGKELGLEVPQIPQPKSMDDLGRQWTASGDDKLTKK
ncbi:MAG TPA: DUF1264 domain-containing protein [Candidatus Acidoferrum sp.]|nr:DUF1264 domain-containing protein [Candidatus Acidoferrum sp.]